MPFAGRGLYDRACRSEAVANTQSMTEHAPRSPFRSYEGALPPTPPSAEVLARFASIVGAKYALTAAADRAPYEHEWREHFTGQAAMVLRPKSVDEVAAILKLANETRTAIVPQGGNTGLVGGQTPHETGHEIVLSLTRLDRIRETDPTGNTLTAEAGVVLQRVQEEAARVERLFPLSLAAEGSCTIGGVLATNAGGVQALVYGTARDLVLGLEVVLADGRVWHGLRRLKKDNTGYDLRHVFVGSEGTLGVITAAVLKLFPRPSAQVTAFAGLPSPEAALDLLSLLQARASGAVTSFELLPRIAIETVTAHDSQSRDPLASPHPWYALIEVSAQAAEGLRASVETALAEAIENGGVSDAAIAQSLEQRNAFWRIREMLPEKQKTLGGSIKHDVSVPVAAVPSFIARASAEVTRLIPGCRPVPFGHLGDGNIHFNISQPEGADKTAFLARWNEVNELVHGVVAAFGGSISAEHGIGRLKRHLLPGVKDAVELDLMRSLKRVLDPNGILNPGKVL